MEIATRLCNIKITPLQMRSIKSYILHCITFYLSIHCSYAFIIIKKFALNITTESLFLSRSSLAISIPSSSLCLQIRQIIREVEVVTGCLLVRVWVHCGDHGSVLFLNSECKMEWFTLVVSTLLRTSTVLLLSKGSSKVKIERNLRYFSCFGTLCVQAILIAVFLQLALNVCPNNGLRFIGVVEETDG